MKIDNENTVVKIQALKYIYAIAVLTTMVVLYTTNIEPFLIKYLGLSNLWVTLILVFVYLLYYFYHLASRTSYLFLSDEGHKITIRFYQLKPMNPKKNAYEIPKTQFVKFSYSKTFLREEITVYQKIGSSISKYPPFSLKGLSQEQKALLLLTLKQYQQV
jgi:hypothetical protein